MSVLSRRFDALVIGCSTGGPEALGEIVPRLPADLPVPVLVVQHMPPRFTRLLADRLSGLGPIRFREAEHGAQVRPGEGWIAQGGRHMVVVRLGPMVQVGLDDGPFENSCRPAVDTLLRSAVQVYGGRVLAVILTGMGQDGLKGAAQVRQAGGVVLAQDQDSSVVWGMPGVVAQAGLAEAVLPLSEIAGAVVDRLGPRTGRPAIAPTLVPAGRSSPPSRPGEPARSASPSARSAATSSRPAADPSQAPSVLVPPFPALTVSPEDLEFVRGFARTAGGLALGAGHEHLIEARLASLGRRSGLGDPRDVVRALRGDAEGEVGRRVLEALATHETSFFRDEEVFEELRTFILPDLVRCRADQRTLRLWSAACSTGQEAYSLAILLRERFAYLQDWSLQVLGTDLSRAVVERARGATYTELELSRGISASRQARHFESLDLGFRVREPVRALVRFAELNLAVPWPELPQQDLVLMRNVLIYFEREAKEAILERLRSVLAPDGYLFLGSAEATFLLDEGFVREHRGKVGWYRRR